MLFHPVSCFFMKSGAISVQFKFVAPKCRSQPCHGVTVIKTWMNTGAGWQPSESHRLPEVLSNYSMGNSASRLGTFVDLNADGLVDLVRSYIDSSGAQYREAWMNTGTSWEQNEGYRPPTVSISYQHHHEGLLFSRFIDLNGDHLPDLLVSRDDYVDGIKTEKRSVWLNTGVGWEYSQQYLPTVAHWRNHVSNAQNDQGTSMLGFYQDMNRDGLIDLVRAFKDIDGTEYIDTWVNTGSGWRKQGILDLPVVFKKISRHENRQLDIGLGFFADMNSDGMEDFVISAKGEPRRSWAFGLGNRSYAVPETVIKTENGFGFVSQVQMKPPTHVPGMYIPSLTRTYPLVPMNRTGPLVSELETSDGLGGWRRLEFEYGEKKVDLIGRRNPGFGSNTAIDRAKGIRTVTTLMQEYPHAGRISNVKKYVGDVLISEVRNSYQFADVGADIGADIGMGKALMTYQSASTYDSYESDGSFIDSKNMNAVVDGFGNTVRRKTVFSNGTSSHSREVLSRFNNDITHYNSLGRVTSMSDAKGTQTVTTYDLLNRPLTRIDSFGAQDASTTIWTYDNSEGGIGKISSVTDGGGYSRLYSYDDHGREETVDEVIDGQSYKTKTLYRGATQKVDGIVYPNEMLVRTDYNEYGFPVEVRSAGMVEYQQYLDQKSLIEDLGNEANLLFENLEPVRAEHVKKYNALVTRGAEPAIKPQDFASKGDAEMGAYQSWVTLTNRYAVQRSSAISLYNGLVHEHNAKQEEIVKLEARTCPFAGHVRRGEGRSAAFDKKEAQYQQCMKEKHGTIAHNRNRVSEINDKLPPIKSRIDHLLVKRQESEAKADRYMMQARAYFDQANDYSTKARFYYDKAAIHLTSIESINRQIRSKISLVEGAIDKAASMLMMYEGGSVLQWDAGEVDAYGRVTRFTQGNGTVTKLDYDPKSRQISHILTQLDNGNSAYSSIDGVGTSLSQLSNLILNFGEIAERHKVKAQNARKSREEGLKALSLLEETRGVLMIQNKPLDASSLQPEIAKQQLEIDLQEGDMTLFEGLSAIHHNTALILLKSGRKLTTLIRGKISLSKPAVAFLTASA
ncbi:MAG: hypothetical protein GKR95_14760 [Gammaproteobacteria bacterium]|nr:hypothetical protein [Gammaproteobacteria bacterium]